MSQSECPELARLRDTIRAQGQAGARLAARLDMLERLLATVKAMPGTVNVVDTGVSGKWLHDVILAVNACKRACEPPAPAEPVCKRCKKHAAISRGLCAACFTALHQHINEHLSAPAERVVLCDKCHARLSDPDAEGYPHHPFCGGTFRVFVLRGG